MLKLVEALKNAGIPMPSKGTEDFKIIRWGKNNRYWLKKFIGGYVFGDFVNGINAHVFEQSFKGEKLKKIHEELKKTMELVEYKSSKIYELSSDKAKLILNNARRISKNRYLDLKKVRFLDLKEYKGSIIVPAYDVNGKLWTLQFIDPEGNKRFLSGGKKKGCFFTFGSIENTEKVFICEGFATGATIYECSETPVIVAFDAGNLKPVAQSIREKYQNLKLIFCADNDTYNEVNVGVEKAQEAAQIVDGEVIVPQFKDKSTHPTDFNDLMILEGGEAVKEILSKELHRSKQDKNTDSPLGFSLSEDGLFCIDKKSQELIRVSNYIKVIAFTKSNDEVSRLIEFRDYKGDVQSTIIKSSMFTKDGEQIRINFLLL